MVTMSEERETGHTNEIDVDEIYKNLESDKYSVYLNDNDTDGGAD